MRTARVTVLMEPDEKRALTNRAGRLGISTGELLRLAAERFDDDELEAELEAATRELEDAIPKMNASFDAIDHSLAGSRAAVREALDHFESKKS